MGVRGPKRGSVNPLHKNLLSAKVFREKQAATEAKIEKRKKEAMSKDPKTRRDHFKGFTKKEIGIVIDYILLDDKTEAARRNYDVNPTLASKFAYQTLLKPKMKAAIEAELKKLDADISEDYITNALLSLEGLAKDKKDLPALKGAYDLMMRLKGLGAQRIINENYTKDSFELKAPEEMQEALVNTIIALEEKKLLDYDTFLQELESKRDKPLLEEREVTEVKVIEEPVEE